MISINGGLTTYYGLYTATFIVHVVGLVVCFIIALIKKEKVPKFKRLPFWLYIGGLIGFLTTVFNNIAVGKISISAILALSLFGQALTSLLIDCFGLFNMPKRKFYPFKIIGLLIVLIGIIFMLYPFEFNAMSILSIIVSILSGVTCNVSRATNAALSDETGMTNSTMINYIMGFAISLVFMIVFGIINKEEIFANGISFSKDIWIYLGGAIGAVVVFITNKIFSKTDTLYATLLLFSGQVFTGIIIDLIIYNSFSFMLLIGGLITLAGLIFNLLFERFKNNKTIKID